MGELCIIQLACVSPLHSSARVAHRACCVALPRVLECLLLPLSAWSKISWTARRNIKDKDRVSKKNLWLYILIVFTVLLFFTAHFYRYRRSGPLSSMHLNTASTLSRPNHTFDWANNNNCRPARWRGGGITP